MDTKVENLDNGKVKLTVEVPAKKFEEGMNHAFNKVKGDIALQGFRKGKAPRALVEKVYGREMFYDDAINFVIPEVLDKAIEENNIDIAASIDFQNDFEIESIEKGKPFVFKVEIVTQPEVKLGKYKGLEVSVPEVEVTQEDVLKDIEAEREKNSREITITDRAVEPQDKVLIDFEGFIDGEPFAGGQAEDHELVIGSGSFIGNFEDQLIGKNIGDDIEVNVTFPEDYQEEDLQDKPAMFKVKIKSITVKELPELNDDFAADVSDFDTLDEYKEDIKAKLTEEKNKARESEIEKMIVDAAVENAELDIPEAMINDQVDRNMDNVAQQIGQQGLDIDTYLQFLGQTREEFRETFVEDSSAQIKSRIVLEAISKAEDTQVTDEAVEEELVNMAERLNMELDQIKETVGEEQRDMLKDDLKVRQTVEMLVKEAKVINK